QAHRAGCSPRVSAAGQRPRPLRGRTAGALLRARPGVPAPRQPRLLDRVREALLTYHSSRRTEKWYVAWTRRYIVFQGERHPAETGGGRAHAVPQTSWPSRTTSRPRQNQALSALLFLHLAAGVHRVIDHATPCQV